MINDATSTVQVSQYRPPKKRRSLVKRLILWAFVALFVLLLLFAAFFWWASGGDSDERAIAPGAIVENQAAPPAPAQVNELRVMTFNIAYGRGPAGDAAGPWTEDEIRAGLSGISEQIVASQADLVFLQEVDLASSRSHDIDEGQYLLDASGLRFKSCVITWEKNYVPFPYWPPSKHYGAMKSGQCVLSRFPITSSTRHRLPKPESNPWWRNAFYLDRAFDQVTLTIAGHAWEVINVHTEAFDIPNRVEHAKQLVTLISEAKDKARLIVAGDFNALPPEASQKKGFVDEPETDFTSDTTIAVVREAGLSEVLPDPSTFTFPADGPTRRLDYIWFGAALERIEAKVLTPPPGPFSDHLAVLARFTIR